MSSGATIFVKLPNKCPVAGPVPPPAAAITPNAVAVEYWKAIALPVPKPSIPPGYAICGQTAYLVTDNTTAPPTYHFNTPLGPLTITASGVYHVTWGDQNPSVATGPYAYEGGPYPNGRITHVYDVAGQYTVGVQETWTATWQLGGASGTLGGLQTQASIPNFRVDQLQAVISG